MKKCIIFFIAINFFLVEKAASQEYYFKHYKVEDGLSYNTISSLLQDNAGFLWFGTKDGLNRFDGYTFKVFRNNPSNPKSIGSNYIKALHEFNGYLWIGTDKGLFRYSELDESFELVLGTYNKPIIAIENDMDGNLWYIIGGVLYKLNITEKDYLIKPSEAFDQFYFTLLKSNDSGDIWVSSSTSLYKYEPDNNSLKGVNIKFQNPVTITALSSKGIDTILIGTKNQGAYFYYTKAEKLKAMLPQNLNLLHVRCFLNFEKKIWIGSESGMYIIDELTGDYKHLKKNYNNNYSLSDNAIYCMVADDEKGVWVGTYFGGINYFPKQYTPIQKFFPKTEENAISGNAVREIKKDYLGNLWIGTEDAGLNKYNLNTGIFTKYDTKSLSHYNIHGLLCRGNELWIGTFENGLDILNISTGKVIKHFDSKTKNSGLQSDFILYIYEDKDKNVYILTAYGLHVYDETNDNFKIFESFPESHHYTYFLEDSSKNKWAGTYWNGLFFYDPITHKRDFFKHDKNDINSISSNIINGIFEDSKNNLWVTTENGLNLYQPKTNNFKRFTVKDGFPSNVFYSILEDSLNNLWISTSKGMTKFNVTSGEIIVFTKVNGLLSDQFNYNSSFKDIDGTMYFGSVNGLVKFHPDSFIKNDYHPKVLLTNLKINNKNISVNSKNAPSQKSITFSEDIILKNDQSTFSIEFASLGYTTPELTEYWYKLKGLNDDWLALGKSHEVHFTELGAGEYVLKVKSKNSYGVWSKESKSLKIKILPYFLLSNLAKLIYTIAIISLLLFVLNYYHKYNRNKNNQKIKHLNNQKEKEIYKAKIDFFTNIAHEIRTPLTLIKSPLEKLMRLNVDPVEIEKNLAIMDKNTSRLINLCDQLLDFRKSEIENVKLNYIETDIKALVYETHLRFTPSIEKKDIHFTINTDENELIAFIDKEIIQKILSNLFSNGIKYSAKKVNVILSNKKEYFEIIIENDGKLIPDNLKDRIFEPFFRIPESEQKEGTGIGLTLAHSLVELHNGRLFVDKNAKNINRFILKIPIHQDLEYTSLKPKSKLKPETIEKLVSTIEEKPKESVKKNKEKKQRILLVEDNVELSDFVFSELTKKYIVKVAQNGNEALEILKKEKINLIISDIMMPIMDGITLCIKIKATPEISHLPVILLTAKSALKAKITGLESGADAYITKPFSIDFLLVQIQNILENRKTILELYSSSPLSYLKQIELSNSDSEFIKALDEVISEHLHNQNLNVDFLANCLNISKSTLFRKIKETTNMGTNELINISRLKKAAILLRTTNLRVYEIAEQVGYKSQISFGRNFLKYFKTTPTAYVKEKNND
tara:strand:- start:800 stop:4777 length:3978 start_codon:yes stop_codon:yes gene_type:complete